MLQSDENRPNRSDHVAIVRPRLDNTRHQAVQPNAQGVYFPNVAQAGAIVSADMASVQTFGSNLERIKFFWHA
jgi:hypothetical protein